MPAYEPNKMKTMHDRSEELQANYPSPSHDGMAVVPSWNLLLGGLALVGLGVLAWQYLGPDVRRYAKMSSM